MISVLSFYYISLVIIFFFCLIQDQSSYVNVLLGDADGIFRSIKVSIEHLPITNSLDSGVD